MAEALSNDPSLPEAPTPPRYSLAYDAIGSRDMLVKHTSGAVRVVSYERSHGGQTRVREALLQHGLIVGAVLSEVDAEIQAFRVPKSARPIAYDASVETAGAFSYNDEQLFFDLGCLLGELAICTDETTVITGDIGRTITFIEFTQPSERQLFFVPGVEKVTASLQEGIEPLGYYADKLTEAFGHRFDTAGLFFRMGFGEATSISDR